MLGTGGGAKIEAGNGGHLKLGISGKLFHLTRRVLLHSLQLPPMGLQLLPMSLLLGRLLGP